jgi:thiol-disulfide isomerase/thioredoxin
MAVLALSNCNDEKKNQAGETWRKEMGMQNIILTDLRGQPVKLDQFAGKTVFISFWATWCKPCLQEMPSIQKTQHILREENIVFLFASEEASDQIEEFKINHDYNFTYLRVENLEELNIVALPTTFIFNTDGQLVFNEMGYRKWDDKTNIDLLLNISKPK